MDRDLNETGLKVSNSPGFPCWRTRLTEVVPGAHVGSSDLIVRLERCGPPGLKVHVVAAPSGKNELEIGRVCRRKKVEDLFDKGWDFSVNMRRF